MLLDLESTDVSLDARVTELEENGGSSGKPGFLNFDTQSTDCNKNMISKRTRVQ